MMKTINRQTGTAFVVHQWLQIRGSKFYGFFFKGGSLSTKMEIRLKHNYAFSNIAVKFCETFTCPSCKQHEISDMRHYFVTAACVQKFCTLL